MALPSLATAELKSADVICSSSRLGDLTALSPDCWRGLTSLLSPAGQREQSCARSVCPSGETDGEVQALMLCSCPHALLMQTPGRLCALVGLELHVPQLRLYLQEKLRQSL